MTLWSQALFSTIYFLTHDTSGMIFINDLCSILLTNNYYIITILYFNGGIYAYKNILRRPQKDYLPHYGEIINDGKIVSFGYASYECRGIKHFATCSLVGEIPYAGISLYREWRYMPSQNGRYAYFGQQNKSLHTHIEASFLYTYQMVIFLYYRRAFAYHTDEKGGLILKRVHINNASILLAIRS